MLPARRNELLLLHWHSGLLWHPRLLGNHSGLTDHPRLLWSHHLLLLLLHGHWWSLADHLMLFYLLLLTLQLQPLQVLKLLRSPRNLSQCWMSFSTPCGSYLLLLTLG